MSKSTYSVAASFNSQYPTISEDLNLLFWTLDLVFPVFKSGWNLSRAQHGHEEIQGKALLLYHVRPWDRDQAEKSDLKFFSRTIIV